MHMHIHIHVCTWIYIYILIEKSCHITGVRLMKVKSGVLFFNKNMCT